MTKKLLFFFITLTTFTNVSYASFPIADTLEIKQDISLENKVENNAAISSLGLSIIASAIVKHVLNVTKRTMIKLSYAFGIRLSSKYSLSAGVFAGIQQYNTNFKGLKNSTDPVLATIDGVELRYPDIMPGVLP